MRYYEIFSYWGTRREDKQQPSTLTYPGVWDSINGQWEVWAGDQN